MKSGTIKTESTNKNTNNNSDKSHRIYRSINKSHGIESEILFQLPTSTKDDFVSLVSKLHNGNVANYQNYEVIQALKHMVESWMSMREKPKAGIFSLSVDSCPKPNIIAKLIMMSEIAKVQPPSPKFTARGLMRISKLTFPVSAKETTIKFADILKTLSDVDANEDNGIERDYNLYNFYKIMDRMKHMNNQKERDVLWSTHFGYKFAIKKNTINPSFESNTKLSSIHARIPTSLKDQIHAILREKYSGRIRTTQSFEMANAISNYIYFVNNEKSSEPTKDSWESKKL